MFLKIRFSLFILLCILLLTTACGSKKKLAKSGPALEVVELINTVKQKELNFDTFSSKVDFSFQSKNNKNLKLKATLRMKNDSLIWVSITPLLGIEVARALITPDTVKVINRINKEYFIGGFSYFNELLDMDLDFEILQAILIGNSIPYTVSHETMLKIEEGLYHLSNLKRKENEEIDYWISSENSKNHKFTYSDKTAKRFLIGEYADFTNIDGQLIPEKLNFELQDANTTAVEIRYSRVSLDKFLNFSFNISSKYERVVY